jgi:hypothetical protein
MRGPRGPCENEDGHGRRVAVAPFIFFSFLCMLAAYAARLSGHSYFFLPASARSTFRIQTLLVRT